MHASRRDFAISSWEAQFSDIVGIDIMKTEKRGSMRRHQCRRRSINFKKSITSWAVVARSFDRKWILSLSCPLPVHLRHDIDKKVNACGSLLHGSSIFSAPALRSSFLSAGQNSNTSVTDDGRNCFKQIAGHRIGCSEKNWHCNCVAYWSSNIEEEEEDINPWCQY